MAQRNGTDPRQISRRTFLKGAGVVGVFAISPTLLAACGSSGDDAADELVLKVLTNQPPDPAPPGVAPFALDQFNAWQAANAANVSYESIPYGQIHDKLATAFASGNPPWDVVYMAGWAPEFSDHLFELGNLLSAETKADMPASSFNTVSWDGKTLGAVFTLSLMTLFYNTEHFAEAGLTDPPKNWEELVGYTRELTRDGRYGWVNNYGAPEGIGGTANIWMAYLQQAGGTMYKEDGSVAFDTNEGVDALQLILDLWEAGTEPGSISYVGIADTTNVFTSGKASMMMNWPFTWKPANDPEQSQIAGQLGSAVLPAGPAGTASIDGTDAFTVPLKSRDPELATKLVEFYLSPDVQKAQALDTGWLPIRKSMLADPDVQAAAPNAGVLLQQADAPYDSFVTPDYIEVTQAIGTEIQRAIRGEKSASDAIKDSADAANAIIAKR
jgi:multiple sugar transport system substrate-binding protein